MGAPGAAAFSGSRCSSVGTGVPEAADHLWETDIIYFLMLDSMLVNLSLF